MRFEKSLVFVLVLVLFVPLVFSLTGDSDSYDSDVKMDSGSDTNASSDSFVQRFIFGSQPVSQYSSDSYSGRWGILSAISNVAINLTYPVNGQEVVRGGTALSHEDPSGIVSDYVLLQAKVYLLSSSAGISDINVSFYFNDSLIGTNLTNSSGIAVFNYNKASLDLGTHSVYVNYTTNNYNKLVSDSEVDFNLVAYTTPNFVSNYTVIGGTNVYVDGSIAKFYFNVTKVNTSGSSLYDPSDIIVNATTTEGLTKSYYDSEYVDGYRNLNLGSGQYTSWVYVNKSKDQLNPYIRWEVLLSDDGFETYIGSARHNDVGLALCGDGFIDPGEQCEDGGRCDNGDYCEIGYLSCSDGSTCRAVSGDGCSSTCQLEICGNNIADTEADEVCDGTDLAGESCTTQGFTSGTLACADGCQAFDTSSCTNDDVTPPPGGQSCKNECTSGAVESVCSDLGNVQTRTCGNYDSDSCTEWGNWEITTCSTSEVCSIDSGVAQCVESECEAFWVCEDWGQCTSGFQTRTCSNSYCNLPDREETQSCEVCVEDWVCDWTLCSTGTDSSFTTSGITGNVVTGFAPKEDKGKGSESFLDRFIDRVKEAFGLVKKVEFSEDSEEDFSDGSVGDSSGFDVSPSPSIEGSGVDNSDEDSATFMTQSSGSSYSSDYSYPYNCYDRNSCGTEEFKPEPVLCSERPDSIYYDEFGNRCSPNWVCGDWGICEAEYSIAQVLLGYTKSSGISKRSCYDSTGCVNFRQEKVSCDMNIPIEARKVEWCQQTYIEIVDKTTNQLVSRVKESLIGNFTRLTRIDISFISSEVGQFCDYCYDGKKNYDETGVDCGGPSCPACSEVKSFFDWAFWLAILLWIIFLALVARIIYLERKERSVSGNRFGLWFKNLFKRKRKVVVEKPVKKHKWFAGLFARKHKVPEKIKGDYTIVKHVKEREEKTVYIPHHHAKKHERHKKKEIKRKARAVAKVRRKSEKEVKRKEKAVVKEKKRKRRLRINDLKKKIKLWRRQGYYGTAKLEAELKRLQRERY